MRVAFYAPLKPPDHPVPSGDRQIARLLLRAIATRGHDVEVVSRFRSFDARGDSARQARLGALGARIAQRLVARSIRERRPDIWFTYHLHHKAPDCLGPTVSRALGIPYVVAEASVAPRQRDGRWATGYAESVAAIRAADAVVFLNPADVAQVRRVRGPDAPAALLAPFIDAAAFTAPCRPGLRRPSVRPVERRLVTVAMMRDGAKLASYRTLATALAAVRDLPWRLTIVGDGPARPEVTTAFAPLANRVEFIGARSAMEIASRLCDSDLFVWPAVDEALGLVFLEAQVCGVPVIGADTPGVAALVDPGRTGLLVPPGNADAFAEATRRLLCDGHLRERMATAAPAHVRRFHDLPIAAAQLDAILHEVANRAATERRASVDTIA